MGTTDIIFDNVSWTPYFHVHVYIHIKAKQLSVNFVTK